MFPDLNECGRRNPFPVYEYPPQNDVRPNPIVGWKWLDSNHIESAKTYPSQLEALTDMLRYIRWTTGTPTLWESVWWPLRFRWWPLFKRFFADTSSGAR